MYSVADNLDEVIPHLQMSFFFICKMRWDFEFFLKSLASFLKAKKNLQKTNPQLLLSQCNWATKEQDGIKNTIEHYFSHFLFKSLYDEIT